MSDYLAMINTNGIGSWSRGPDREKVIRSLVGRFHGDWRSLFKPKSPRAKVTVKIKLYDIEGHDQVWWDEYVLYGEDDEPLDIKPEIIEHTYKSW